MRTIKNLTPVFALLLFVISAAAQQRVIDKEACDQWEMLKKGVLPDLSVLSNDGKFFAYATGSKTGSNTVTIASTSGDYSQTFPGARSAVLASDVNKFFILLAGDTLAILKPGEKKMEYLPGVSYFFMAPEGRGRFGMYHTTTRGNFRLRNLENGQETNFSQVQQTWFNQQGTMLLLQDAGGLHQVDLPTGKKNLIDTVSKITRLSFAPGGEAFVYIAASRYGHTIRYCKKEMATPLLLAEDREAGVNSRVVDAASFIQFNEEGSLVLFSFREVKNTLRQEGVITDKVNVWNYRDRDLQQKQLSHAERPEIFQAVADLRSGALTVVENDTLRYEYGTLGKDHLVLTSRVSDDEFYWNGETKSAYLLQVSTGQRKRIAAGKFPSVYSFHLSPDNQYLTWFDGNRNGYYSFELATGKERPISDGIPESLVSTGPGEGDKLYSRFAYYGSTWLNNNKGQGLLICTRNDLWLLDPSGKQTPQCITNGYGRKNNIRFRLLTNDDGLYAIGNNELLAWAFNNNTKENGFWKITRNGTKDPAKLVMGPHTWYHHGTSLRLTLTFNPNEEPEAFKPIKARNKGLYLVRRMSAAECPNLYLTTDFITFKKLTDIQPGKNYNWHTADLISWKLSDGQRCDGILYKPQNFNPAKKYPVIFNYYERSSEGLHLYRVPELAGHNISIAWYTSRGYLVFEPDIYYKRGKVFRSIVDVVTTATQQLATLPYVDTARMGAQGQSFGGYETYVMATGTKLFKAASGMAGPTNIISEYGSIRPGGHNNQTSADVGQRNIGVFPWENPQAFIENSPVFHAGKTTTPLLIVHNRGDGAILFPQAIELYMALRRAGKKVWMLEYDGEGHGIDEENNQLDFTIRMQQYFDHYLKGEPAPIWMTRGIPARLKGIESGLRPDNTTP